MDLSGLLAQLLNGLAGASTLFLVAAGLSLIFGVTRIVNFAHGSFYMLGLYLAYSCVEGLAGAIGFWPALLLAPLAVGLLGAAVERLLLRRIYGAPELLQLLATFALVLVIKDAALWIWGPEELLGPRAPGLSGSVNGAQTGASASSAVASGLVPVSHHWRRVARAVRRAQAFTALPGR